MSKNHVAGGKFTSSHTTVIPFAKEVLKAIERLPLVEKISLGVIHPKLKSTNDRRVKIQKDRSSVILKIRDTSSLQEVRIYSSSLQDVMLSVAKELRNEGIKIHFV